MRNRVPNRRTGFTETVMFGSGDNEISADVTINIDVVDSKAWPEMFLSGAKVGSGLWHLFQDTATIISIALQYGVPPELFAKAISRIPVELDGPPVAPGSVIGAALDLYIKTFNEWESARET